MMTKKALAPPGTNKVPLTRAMLCYIAYITFILINDYITYFRLFSAPLMGYGLAALITLGAAFALKRFVVIEKTPFHWVDIIVIIGCLALYALKAALPNHWFDADH